jgi:flagellar export protein FliJ
VAVSRALLRLLRVLEIEEEQHRMKLEAELGELGLLEHALEGTNQREQHGRRLVGESAHSGELRDRLSGVEETRAARRMADVLKLRVAETEEAVAVLRQHYLAKRVKRRQVETLVEKAEAEEALETERRSQQMLDEWFLSRFQGVVSDTKEQIASPDARVDMQSSFDDT